MNNVKLARLLDSGFAGIATFGTVENAIASRRFLERALLVAFRRKTLDGSV
jgi:hypothetical protein